MDTYSRFFWFIRLPGCNSTVPQVQQGHWVGLEASQCTRIPTLSKPAEFQQMVGEDQ